MINIIYLVRSLIIVSKQKLLLFSTNNNECTEVQNPRCKKLFKVKA